MERMGVSELMGLPLLQHGELPVAKEIADPLAIAPEKLEMWLNFSRELCNKQSFICLALTQLKPEVKNFLGFSDELPPRVMFIRDHMKKSGMLVVNPEIGIALGTRHAPFLEGCGSIQNAKVVYFIRRPVDVTVYGYFYNGLKLRKGEYIPENLAINFSIHEIDHLNGKTALNRSRDILDPRNKNTWKYIRGFYDNYDEEEFKRLVMEGVDGVLVYNKWKRRFEKIQI